MTALDFTLERNPFGRLVLTLADGTRHEGVTPVRAFPVAAPLEGVSLVATDGHEAAWVPRLGDVSGPTRDLIEQELASREFVPHIQRLVSVSSFSTPSTWQIETDRGPTQFVLKGEEDIRRLEGRRKLMIASEEGIHFLVPDVHALDKASRKLLERFL
jgi:hypothetical protein